nr:hypothetical protein [Tanacetum cinerariifolium]
MRMHRTLVAMVAVVVGLALPLSGHAQQSELDGHPTTGTRRAPASDGIPEVRRVPPRAAGAPTAGRFRGGAADAGARVQSDCVWWGDANAALRVLPGRHAARRARRRRGRSAGRQPARAVAE